MLIDSGNRSKIKKIKSVLDAAKNEILSDEIQKLILRIEAKLDKKKGMLSEPEFTEKDGALSISDEAGTGSLSIEDPKDK